MAAQLGREYDPRSTLVVRARDGRAHKLTPDMDARRPLWSPVGNRILYYGRKRSQTVPPRPYGLWLVESDGSGQREIMR